MLFWLDLPLSWKRWIGKCAQRSRKARKAIPMMGQGQGADDKFYYYRAEFGERVGIITIFRLFSMRLRSNLSAESWLIESTGGSRKSGFSLARSRPRTIRQKGALIRTFPFCIGNPHLHAPNWSRVPWESAHPFFAVFGGVKGQKTMSNSRPI